MGGVADRRIDVGQQRTLRYPVAEEITSIPLQRG